MTYAHTPVLLDEVLALLDPHPGESYLDATLGGGGHAAAVALKVGPTGIVYGIDRDPAAVQAATVRLQDVGTPFRVHQGRFGQMGDYLREMGVGQVDLLLADLGLSSPQVDDANRGFSYAVDGPLDMRMDPSSGPTASEWLMAADEAEIERVLHEYGEERHAHRIARILVEERARHPITGTHQLVEIVRRAYPAGGHKGVGHPARRTFQAVRIAVNRELTELAALLASLRDLLRPGGRAAIISFHSLEDRMVKRAFLAPGYERLTRKPIVPADAERKRNPRARSAKLRAVRILPRTSPV